MATKGIQVITRLEPEDYEFMVGLGPELVELEQISKPTVYEIGRFFLIIGIKFYIAEKNKVRLQNQQKLNNGGIN